VLNSPKRTIGKDHVKNRRKNIKIVNTPVTNINASLDDSSASLRDK